MPLFMVLLLQRLGASLDFLCSVASQANQCWPSIKKSPQRETEFMTCLHGRCWTSVVGVYGNNRRADYGLPTWNRLFEQELVKSLHKLSVSSRMRWMPFYEKALPMHFILWWLCTSFLCVSSFRFLVGY